MKAVTCLVLTTLMLLVGRSRGDMIVDTYANVAIQNLTEDGRSAEAIWCDPFYFDDFPQESNCADKMDGIWDVFPACCNGAYNCLHGIVWDIVLCPAEHVYDPQAERCLPYIGVGCPLGGGPTPGDDSSTTVATTEEPPLSCNNVRTGKLPYAPDCTKYIKCSKGEPTLESCPIGYIFYVPFSACLPGELRHCALYQV